MFSRLVLHALGVGDILVPLPTLAYATFETDPVGSLVNYGVLGIFAAILVYVVRYLYKLNVNNFEAQLAYRDKIIADKDVQLGKKDEIIDLLLQQGRSAIPALQRAAQVMEILPQQAAPSDDLTEIKEVLPRLTEILSKLEAKK